MKTTLKRVKIKTTLETSEELFKAVSGEANVPFYAISGSDFIEMFVGKVNVLSDNKNFIRNE